MNNGGNNFIDNRHVNNGGNNFIDNRHVNNGGNFNRPNYGNWYHGDWHNHWDHPWNYRPYTWWAAGAWTGAAVAAAVTAPWSWGYWPYSNPYCVDPVVVGNTTIDYSQPIVLAQPVASPAGGQSDADAASAEDLAMQRLNAARDAFAAGDYATAGAQIDQAIVLMPNDAVLHEFRGLVLFAMKQYKPAAAAVYAVLSVGPGWDWTTVSSMYPDVNVYTAQLRELEAYRSANPKQGDARFLLAYHYLICGHADSAMTELKAAVQLNPKDQLSAQLLAGLADQASPAQPASGQVVSTPPKPADAAKLVGDWKATRSDSATVALNLTNDGKYTWTYTQQGKPQAFSGTYTVADNLLILRQNNNPAMIGQVAMSSDEQFNFKLANDSPTDPGLTFSK